jgi:hypothetical protein
VNIDQSVPTPTTVGQPLIRTITIDDVMPFHILITSDVEVSSMSQ